MISLGSAGWNLFNGYLFSEPNVQARYNTRNQDPNESDKIVETPLLLTSIRLVPEPSFYFVNCIVLIIPGAYAYEKEGYPYECSPIMQRSLACDSSTTYQKTFYCLSSLMN